jgi:hypothetical protein
MPMNLRQLYETFNEALRTNNVKQLKDIIKSPEFTVFIKNCNQSDFNPLVNIIGLKSADAELIDLCIAKGANPNKDSKGMTPLMYALQIGKNDLLKCLLKKKVNVNILDKVGRSPLHMAVSRNNAEVVSLLLENGADINLKDARGFTPAHVAATLFFPTILKQLIEHKDFDPTIISNQRQTFDVIFASKFNSFISLDLNELAKDKENSKKVIESLEMFPLISRKLEEKLQKNKTESPPGGKNKYNVPELIKSVSIPYNPRDREDYNNAIDVAWTVAEKAATRGDLSLKANLTHYASQIAEYVNKQELRKEEKGKEIAYINANKCTVGRGAIAGGFSNPKQNKITVTINPANLPYNVENIMHEIMHDTINYVFKNNSLPNKASGEIQDDKAINRQISAFTEDIKALYKLTRLSNAEKASKLKELSNRVGDLITPHEEYRSHLKKLAESTHQSSKLKDLTTMNTIELDYGKRRTRRNFSNILEGSYVTKGAKNNKKIIIDDLTEQRELEYNEQSVRLELYTYLYSQKAHEYTRDIEKHGEITKPSNVEKYAPNILVSFEQDFAEHILPALKDRLTAIEQGSGIKIEGAATTLEQIDAYLENRKKLADTRKDSNKTVEASGDRLEKMKEDKKSWVSKAGKDENFKSSKNYSEIIKNEKTQKHKRRHSKG